MGFTLVCLLLMTACTGSGGSNTTAGGSDAGGFPSMAGNMSAMATDAGCAVPEGQFLIEYTYVSGNCPAQVASHPILLQAGNHGVSEIQMNRVNDRVEMVIVFKGCQVGFTYNVLTKPDEQAGVPSLSISSVEGDFDVQSETELSGTVTLMQFDPPGTQTCAGEYAVTLTKNEGTIGAGVTDPGGAGDGGTPGFDPASFSGMHLAEITDDCNKTIQCKAQRGEPLPSEDPIGVCVEQSARVLDSQPASQAAFLQDYARCRAFPVCDYVNCAQSGGNSYGDTQRDKIQQACAAEVECNLVRNTPGDSSQVCEEKKVNLLNSYVPTQRDRWEASFEACKGEFGCGFVDCFDAAFFGVAGGQQ